MALIMFGANSITWLPYHLGCVAYFLALAHAQGGPPQDQNAGAGAAATTASPFVVVHAPDGEHSTHVTDMRHLYVPEKRAEALHETVKHLLGDQLAQMTAEISRRTDRIAPVNERELHESGGGRGASSPAMDTACVSAMSMPP
jgi:hypothetical protein